MSTALEAGPKIPGRRNRGVDPIILASSSQRRKELLSLVGIPHEVVPSRIREGEIGASRAEELAVKLALLKARDVAKRYPDRWVLGADTEVWLEGRPLGKPQDAMEAREMLEMLQGRIHEVVTGVGLVRLSVGVEKTLFVKTRVEMRSLSRREMEWYVSTGEPLGKAGGYAIQGKGCVLVKAIEGSYTNVVGLPMAEVVELLREAGAWSI
mgnify:CR=1 FL=1